MVEAELKQLILTNEEQQFTTTGVLQQNLEEIYRKLEESFRLETEKKIALFELSTLQHKNQSQLEQYQSGYGLVAEVR